jgi:hypothetical protein
MLQTGATMRRAYLAAAGGLLLAGLVPVIRDVPNLFGGSDQLFDFTGIGALLGLGTMLLGLVNLANARHGGADPLLRGSVVVANVAVSLVLMAIVARGAGDLYLIVLISLTAMTTALSMLRARFGPRAAAEDGSNAPLRPEAF